MDGASNMAHAASSTAGTLYVVPTPIGNLEDITLRALRILASVGALFVEDTRVTPRLLDRHGIARPPLILACHAHNEHRVIAKIVQILGSGTNVAVVTDAGMPGISDPGFLAIRAAISSGYNVEVLPGACAATTALALSGLPMSSFTFLGFAPRTSGRRRNFLLRESFARHTLIFFEAPHRVKPFLLDAFAVFGDRSAALCFELTKMHERVYRGTLGTLINLTELDSPKGEATIIVAGHAGGRGSAFVAGDAPQQDEPPTGEEEDD